MTRRRCEHHFAENLEGEIRCTQCGWPRTDAIDEPAAQVHADPWPTEVEAADRVLPSTGALRRIVYDALVDVAPYGMTGEELLEAVRRQRPGTKRYSVLPRITELKDAGFAAPLENDDGEPIRRDRRLVWAWTGR